MVNFFIYAKDFSGSTEYEDYYHRNGLKTLEQFKSDVEKIKKELLVAGEPPTESKTIYLHWGHKCDEVDEDTTRKTYLEQEGDHSFSAPYTIINWLKRNYDICGENNKIKLLYIITDGLIDYNNAEECFKLNKKMHYETVVFHAFCEDERHIDLSVAASFFKSHCMVYINYELVDRTNICENINYDKINVDNFAAEKYKLKSYIKLKFIRTLNNNCALQEIEKLKKLRYRLFDELSPTRCDDNLETKDRNVFRHEFVSTEWYKHLIGTVHNKKVDIANSITILINYIVRNEKYYWFDALKFDTKFDVSIVEEPIVDVNFTIEQEIEFPKIILDDDKDIPVIILVKFNLLDKIIFHNTSRSGEVLPASFSKFKSAMECPLFLVKDPDINESIGYFYTLNAYKQLLASDKMIEPRTRRPFYGGLVLTDTKQFDNYNDYILSATYFDFKMIKYNVGLFYYVLWKNCENKEWMDKNVVEHFRKYTMRRISETKCKIGLSSLPIDPQEITSLPTALWYCVEMSSCIFKNDPENFMHERLRMYYGVADYMIEILKYFDYHLNFESIKKRRDLIRHVMTLEKIPCYREKLYYLLKSIFKTVDGFLVSEIENPFNLYKFNYLKLNHKHILHDDVIEYKVHLNDYVHMMHYVGDLNESNLNEICSKTFRPFFAIDQNKSFYTELVKKTKKVVISNDDDEDKIKMKYDAVDSLEFDKVLSLYNLFINCVKDSKKYPTLPEYIEYILKRKWYHGDKVTIFPSNVYLEAAGVYGSYQNLVTKMDVKKFIKVCKTYADRIERVKAEDRVKFNNNNEINEFISSEELKVNLKRVK